MKYLKSYEVHAQDMMSIPTSVKNKNIKYSSNNVQDVMSIPTSINDKMIQYETKLNPYYNFIKALRGISNLTPITYEQVDNLYGFSFIAYYNKVMILTDKISVNVLINEQLIPITKPLEIIKIIESEAI